MTHFKHPNYSRRSVLGGIVTTMATTFGVPAVAGGGDRAATSNTTQRNTDEQRNYTQGQFMRLGETGITDLWYGQRDGVQYSIAGFSDNMTTHMIDMAFGKRSWTRSLMRRLRRIRDMEQRKAALRTEVRRVEAIIAKLDASLERLDPNAQAAGWSETQGQKRDAEMYLKAVRVWFDFPHEGTR